MPFELPIHAALEVVGTIESSQFKAAGPKTRRKHRALFFCESRALGASWPRGLLAQALPPRCDCTRAESAVV